MSEELNRELSLLYEIKRPKFLGFGLDNQGNITPVTGTAYPIGVTTRQKIEYGGDGVFSLSGIMTLSTTITTGTATYSSPLSYKYTVMDQFQNPILIDQMIGTMDLNRAFDNLADSNSVLCPNDSLLIDFTAYSTTSRYYSGGIWGIEFIKLKSGEYIDAYIESRKSLVPWMFK